MRKSRAKKRPILPDPKFNDELVTRFVNTLLKQGKKTTAFQIFYDTIDKIAETTKEEGYPIWKKAVENLMPAVEVRSRRIGGATFQIPAEVRPTRKTALAMKWLINYAAARSGRSMADKLAAESIAAAKGEGAAFKKKEDTHKMAEANKAFAHFRI
ncbi:MAG: 30S ribosomal protein S7 [Chitinophagales bacterium]|jgi:small subunit ribosomal protein S7|nr:30S ribosomal protein S7 [Chitinophagaceae bacterium]MBP9883357.1 30S ribosomal protein S7 [Chitinophagales bacterium]